MLDFNLPIQTRDGRPVRILCTDRKSETPYPVLALATSPSGHEFLIACLPSGKVVDDLDFPTDLVNAPRVDFSKPVRQRDGTPVRILCTDMIHPEYPVVGIVMLAEQELRTWTAEGYYSHAADHTTHLDPRDLVNA